ncbi:MAG TPA: alpha/beta fold hydrolase [Vicinamibacterales bacterium]|nr:alpha/beta fold hydrolase [Vicinamibacterales bacterium]
MSTFNPSCWTRREFLRHTAVAGVAAPMWLRDAHAQPANPSADRALDIAEWSYFWVGVEQAHLARGTMVNGRQMYVEYWIPSRVRYPYAMVLVHGGGGQGLDWMGTPDGRPGWVTYLLREGFRLYVVDRPGHGRSPFHPDLDGPFPPQTSTLESMSGQFTPPNTRRPAVGPYRALHTQWPGTGEIGSPDLDQLVASQGGSYATAGAAPAASGGRGGAAAPPPVDGGVSGGAETAHMVWRQRGAMLVDKIGPSIFMTHSAGGPFGWLVAEARPNLVKGIICIEGAGSPFAGQNIWGLSSIPVAYDPPVSDPAQIKTRTVTPGEPGVQPYRLQEEPARKLKNLQNVPIVIVTAEASFASPGNPGAVAFLTQAGGKAEELRLADHGVRGNGHMMMIEKNNRQVLQSILDWIHKNVPPSSARGAATPASNAAKKKDSTAMALADQGFFWVGTEHKQMPYGTIISGQMYVQYLIPAQVRHPYPVVLVHGATGQMLHYMGSGDGLAGWAHYYVQEGYRVYLVDRPGQGRSPFHPDALGPIGPHPVYTNAVAQFKRATIGPNRQWSGSGDIGDPVVDQFMASQNALIQDEALAQRLWGSRGAELLDKIGPVIMQTHSGGAPFGWLAAAERPKLVKAIVCVEGGGAQPDPAKLRGIPIVYVTAEQSGLAQGPALVARFREAGCDAEDLQLKDRGVLGNGHFMMLENNRRQVFDVIRSWIDQKVPATS